MLLFLFKTISVRQTKVSFPVPASQDWQGLGAWWEGLAVCGGWRRWGRSPEPGAELGLPGQVWSLLASEDLSRVLGSDTIQDLQGGTKIKLTCTHCCI